MLCQEITKLKRKGSTQTANVILINYPPSFVRLFRLTTGNNVFLDKKTSKTLEKSRMYICFTHINDA